MTKRSLCCAIVLACVVVQGCAAPGAVVSRPRNACSVVKGDGSLPDTPALVSLGRSYLFSGLAVWKPSFDLVYATECFNRALAVSPDNYDATMGVGVAYLRSAHFLRGSSKRAALATARQHFGRAYVLRQGAYEPLYYLAEIAVAEKNLDIALSFLREIENQPLKHRGPVLALIGFVYEQQDNPEARTYYLRALQAGWPGSTVEYAAAKVTRRRGGSQ